MHCFCQYLFFVFLATVWKIRGFVVQYSCHFHKEACSVYVLTSASVESACSYRGAVLR